MPDWNDTFTGPSLTGDAIRSILEMMADAVEERYTGQRAGIDFTTRSYSPTSIEGQPASDGSILAMIAALYEDCHRLATLAVRKYDDVGGDYNPVNAEKVDSNLMTADGTLLNFPYPNGWRRKCPREIYKLDLDGEIGQRARFVALGPTLFGVRSDNYWYSVSWNDPLFGTSDRTPDDQLTNAGRFYEYDGTDWIVATDQTSPPDEIDEYVTSGTWVPVSGDHLGVHNLIDIRDAINQCSRFLVGSDGSGPETLSGVDAKVGDVGPLGFDWATTEGKYARDTGVSTLTEVQDAYDAAGTGPFDATMFNGDAYYVGTQTIRDDGPMYFEAVSTRITGRIVVAGSTMTVKVKTLLKVSSDLTRVDETYGDHDVVIDGTWKQIGGEITQSINDESPWFGEIHPTYPAPFADDHTIRGWHARQMVMIYDGEVAGGFTYSALT